MTYVSTKLFSGQQYMTTYTCLERYPKTLLGNKIDREKYFYPELNSYFFNRNKACFDAILTFYQTGNITSLTIGLLLFTLFDGSDGKSSCMS